MVVVVPLLLLRRRQRASEKDEQQQPRSALSAWHHPCVVKTGGVVKLFLFLLFHQRPNAEVLENVKHASWVLRPIESGRAVTPAQPGVVTESPGKFKYCAFGRCSPRVSQDGQAPWMLLYVRGDIEHSVFDDHPAVILCTVYTPELRGSIPVNRSTGRAHTCVLCCATSCRVYLPSRFCAPPLPAFGFAAFGLGSGM